MGLKKCKICKERFEPVYSSLQPTCGKSACNAEYKSKSKGLNKVSDKKKKDDKAYSTLRQVFLFGRPICELSLQGCLGRSTDVHHIYRRGENYLNIKTWMALCRSCHEYVETHPKESREKGWLG